MTADPTVPALDPLLAAIAEGIEIFDLGHPLRAGLPQSSLHPRFVMTLQRRHGDLVRADGSSGANEVIVTGAHVGTHIDALAHISYQGMLHGGVSADDAQRGGRFRVHGAEHIPPLIRRGLLLDIPAVLGVARCEPGFEVTPDLLDAALARTGTRPAPGDVLLVRTGWAQLFDDAPAFEGAVTGTPGPGEAGASWLASFDPVAVGGETIAFERLPGSVAVDLLPGHRVLIVEHGIHIIEVMDLEALAAAGVHEFLFVLSPLRLVGATGSPARPLAIRTRGGEGR